MRIEAGASHSGSGDISAPKTASAPYEFLNSGSVDSLAENDPVKRLIMLLLLVTDSQLRSESDDSVLGSREEVGRIATSGVDCIGEFVTLPASP